MEAGLGLVKVICLQTRVRPDSDCNLQIGLHQFCTRTEHALEKYCSVYSYKAKLSSTSLYLET